MPFSDQQLRVGMTEDCHVVAERLVGKPGERQEVAVE